MKRELGVTFKDLMKSIAVCSAIAIVCVAAILTYVWPKEKPSGTKSTYQSTYQTSERTSSGTPINREFDIDSVSMESTPNSDCFSAIGYKTFQKILVVTFRDSGASYIYKDVPYSVWSDLKGADSMGGYYNKYIKGKYECEKLW